MNPKSSVVRHLSGRSDKFGSSEISIPVPDIGKENKGYDDTSSDKQTQVNSNSSWFLGYQFLSFRPIIFLILKDPSPFSLMCSLLLKDLSFNFHLYIQIEG